VIQDGAKMLHVDTTLVPTLDSTGRPACLSAEVMDGLLRKGLGYEGLILAGPMDSPDLAASHDPVEAALLALRGGADILYWQTNPTVVMRVADKLAAAVKGGLLDEAIIDRAFTRVMEAKIAGVKAAIAPKETTATKGAPASGEKQGSIKDDVLAIERQSITVLRNRGNLLPLDKSDGPFGVTGVVQLDGFKKKLEEYYKPISEQRVTTAKHLGEIQDFEIKRLIQRVNGLGTVMVVITSEQRAIGAQRLVQGLKSKGANVIAIVLGYPALAMQLPDADVIVLGYASTASHDRTLEAVAEALMGEGAVAMRGSGETFRVKADEARSFNLWEAIRMPAGQLPIHLGGDFPLGHGLTYDPANAIKDAVWDFGDGTLLKEHTPQHAFAQPGSYTVTLSVTDTRKHAVTGAFTFIAE
jgi:beta-N-acetylhexosaminidase